MKESYEYPNLLYSIRLMVMKKKKKKKKSSKKLFLVLNWGITKFRLFLVWYEMFFEGIKSYLFFGDCSLTFCKRMEVFETIVCFEEILILALDKASQ